MELSNYPPGVTGMEPEINGWPETVESGQCDSCRLKFDDLTFVWYGDEGEAECPECEGVITKEVPGPYIDEVVEEDAQIADYQRRHRL